MNHRASLRVRMGSVRTFFTDPLEARPEARPNFSARDSSALIAVGTDDNGSGFGRRATEPGRSDASSFELPIKQGSIVHRDNRIGRAAFPAEARLQTE
jgi:hypothetical protein